MIKLLIDGHEAHLAADVSLEIYDRNPFFTSEGQHTLDIELSLSDAQNAWLFSAMHRIDVTSRPKDRQAILYCESGVLISGTEVVLEISDRTVKIQIVAGNSEFNYVTGKDKQLSSLDLGEVTSLTAGMAVASMRGSYPEWDYVCAPVCANAQLYGGGLTVLKDSSTIFNEVTERKTASTIFLKEGTTLCPQPYLAAIVRKVLTALGYKLKTDAIGGNEELKKLIIVHGHKTSKFAEMVEDWTVSEFLTQVENLCAVFFVVDQNTKVVEILRSVDYYKSADVEYVSEEDVVGDIEKKYDQDSPGDITYHNVSYKFPSTDIYKYYAVDSELMKKIEVVRCPIVMPKYSWQTFNMYNVWVQIISGTNFTTDHDIPKAVTDAYDKLLAYYDTGIAGPGFPVVLRSIDPYNINLAMINQFGPRIDPGSDSSMELKLIPAELVWTRLENKFQYPLPVVENGDGDVGTSEEEKVQGLNDRIVNGENEKSSSDTMTIAFYLGLQPNLVSDAEDNIVSPLTVNSSTLIRNIRRINTAADTFWTNQSVVTLALGGNYDLSINSEKGMYNTYWKSSLDVDLTTEFSIKFRSVQRRDVRHIFCISNKKFYCQQLKRNVVNGRLSDVVEGTFYLCDADAQKSSS